MRCFIKKKNNTDRIAERTIENEKHWPLFISIQTFVKYVNLKNCGMIYVIFILLMFGGLFVKSALQNDSGEHPHIYSLQINFWSIILIIFIKIIWQDIPEVNPSVLIGSHSVIILSVNKFWLNKFGPTTTYTLYLLNSLTQAAPYWWTLTLCGFNTDREQRVPYYKDLGPIGHDLPYL